MNCYRLTTLLEIVHGTQPHSSRLVQNGVHLPVAIKLFVKMQLTDWGTLSDSFLDVQVHPHRFRDAAISVHSHIAKLGNRTVIKPQLLPSIN